MTKPRYPLGCSAGSKVHGIASAPDLRSPLDTITTKDRFGLVMVHGEPYSIVDIGMRMLSPRELYRAQSFPDRYIIDPDYQGKPLTKTAQVRMCGNSVPPVVAEALVRANLNEQRTELAARSGIGAFEGIHGSPR